MEDELVPWKPTRVVADLDVRCPAGIPLGEVLAGSGCRCRVTGTNVASGNDPSSLDAFCLNVDGYRACPAWRDDKRRIWERRTRLAGRAG